MNIYQFLTFAVLVEESVVNEKNEIVPMNTEGRFQMTGPSITLGYYNNPEATLECFSSDGWLDTGDIGIISERGLAITGRSKDIIIINGNNYNNSEIEAMIDELDGVEVSYTAAVTVKADPSQNEELAIFFNPTSLGGHSLKATQVVSRVKKEFKIDFAINDLFYNPTIKQLSVVIEERNLELVKNSTDFEKYTVEEKIQGVPASFAQQRLWFLKQYDSQSAFYNMTEALKLSGNMNLDAMNQTVTKILERHEGLRTTFSNVDGTVLQILHPVEAVQIPVEDLSSSSETERDDLISKYISEEINTVFDLETGPLVKFKLLKLEENEHVVLLTMHHIISDGWSMGIFVREFAQIYDAIVSRPCFKNKSCTIRCNYVTYLYGNKTL